MKKKGEKRRKKKGRKKKRKKKKKEKKKKRKKKEEKKETKKKRKKKRKKRRKKEENMFLSFSQDGWSVRAERWVDSRFWRWLTASGRPDQSHRLAPVSHTPYLCPTNPQGRVGGQRQNHALPKGSANHMSPQRDMCEEHRRYFLYRLGPAGGTSTMSGKA